jgi:hypothetical protein
VNVQPSDPEVEALVVDRYLDALLGRRPAEVADLPAALRTAAGALAGDLPRFHPSFRFEEHLAMRLVRAAQSSDQPAAATSGGDVVVFPGHPETLAGRSAGGTMRPVVIGSVLTSAALSLAGAAFVAWRRSHASPEAAMARAIRAVARSRPI